MILALVYLAVTFMLLLYARGRCGGDTKVLFSTPAGRWVLLWVVAWPVLAVQEAFKGLLKKYEELFNDFHKEN